MHRNLDSDGYVMNPVTYLQMKGVTGGLVFAVLVRDTPINNISLHKKIPLGPYIFLSTASVHVGDPKLK